MATSTENYNFKKPDESDFYDIADENKNWDLADEALKNLDTPTFEDYTGSTAVPAATDAINQMKSKRKLGVLLSNIKAAFKGACLIGHIVNNCVTDNAGLPLSAAQGKVLKDLYTQLYSESKKIFITRDHPYNDILFVNENVYGFMSCGPNTRNLPIATYGMALTCKDPVGNWIFVFFLPTSLESLYVNFYNGYSGDSAGWTGWNSVPLSKKK